MGGLLATISFWFVAQKVPKKSLFITASAFCLVNGDAILFSIYKVGGWEGLGLSIFSVALLCGTLLSTILGLLLKKK